MQGRKYPGSWDPRSRKEWVHMNEINKKSGHKVTQEEKCKIVTLMENSGGKEEKYKVEESDTNKRFQNHGLIFAGLNHGQIS